MARTVTSKATLSLFHAPYVDADGCDRMRLSGVLTGAADPTLAEQVRLALEQCATASTVLVVDDSIDVRWLR